MSNLEIFHVGSNSIQGHIPEKLGVPSNMKELFIDPNKLEGEIPEFIFKPLSLQALSLVDNYIMWKSSSYNRKRTSQYRKVFILVVINSVDQFQAL